MSDYISHEAVIGLGYWHGERPTVDNPFPDGVDAVDTKDIESIPAADVRPVVLCRDCKHNNHCLTQAFVEEESRVSRLESKIGLLGVVFIPDKQTMIEMLVAKTATVENAEWTVDAVKQAVDYIVSAIQTLK